MTPRELRALSSYPTRFTLSTRRPASMPESFTQDWSQEVKPFPVQVVEVGQANERTMTSAGTIETYAQSKHIRF
jgi:hypothetical protein